MKERGWVFIRLCVSRLFHPCNKAADQDGSDGGRGGYSLWMAGPETEESGVMLTGPEEGGGASVAAGKEVNGGGEPGTTGAEDKGIRDGGVGGRAGHRRGETGGKVLGFLFRGHLPIRRSVMNAVLAFKKVGKGLKGEEDRRCIGGGRSDYAAEGFVQWQDLKWMEGFSSVRAGDCGAELLATLLGKSPAFSLRHLHCTRNFIHLNLFASFILRALSVFIKDAALKWMYSTAAQQHQWDGLLSYQDSLGCRLVFLLMQYCVAANYYWLLVEGVYLYTLLAFSVFSEQRVFWLYVSIGWGVPLLFVIPWGIVKYLYEDEGCWTRNSNMNYWLIIRLPILFAIGVNFLIFVRVICIVVSKLKANLMCKTDIKCRLAKSTLTLIPLLGTHEVIFAFVMDEHARGTLRFIKLFTELSFTSFQGLMVAILYCFVNNEVQLEFRKSWERWQLEHLHIQRDSSMKPLKCPASSLSSGATVGSSVYAATCQASCN
ncbi:glucagon-like peptide 1 receptor [Carlito syrichta]|uniref:Glucagon-like peptide 1 receptor n=1 Tax=Carlito syrichta TaxID=1868482 RepID=A0A3Q0EBD1_CARSF|nr:glucagon-like peptide 1 receptor [Carlito syrichta]